VVLSALDASENDRSDIALPEPARHKILVADDNRDAADSMAMLLELAGYEVLIAHNGQEALRKIITDEPAAAILDIGMAGMTGYEIARQVRSAGDDRTYLIAVTGWGQADDVARAKQAGFDEHLTKPVDPDRIELLLRARLAGVG
jgi:CheY-like chemotaxis protein